MSKTYTISLSTRQGYRSTSYKSTMNYTSTQSDNRFGRSSTYYYACSMRNTGDDMQHIVSLGIDAWSSASLKITTTGSYSYDLEPSVGALRNDTSSYSKNVKGVTWTANKSTCTYDVLSCGLPTVYGYAIGNNDKNTQSLVISSATLTVVTTETDYTLSYDANGGTGAPSSQTETGIGSYTFTVSTTAPTRTGYDFLGWDLSASATTATYHGGDSITLTADDTLYAVWKLKRYAMTHNPGAGASGATTVVYKDHGLNCQFCTKAMTNYTKAGYDYDGWSLTDGGEKAYNFGQVYATDAPITVYAHWVQTDNIHYKVGGTLYGGQVYAKVNGTLYKGEVWSKQDGQMYKGG